MQKREVHPLTEHLMSNRNAQFWLMQIAGWLGISVISYFSLNLWYNQPEIGYIAHNVLQSVLGMFVSWPLRPIFRKLWDAPLGKRLSLALITVLFFATLWAVLRLLLFMLLTDETDLWPDFGGWLFPSIFIFFCWSALYHGIKYYKLLQEEHKVMLKLATSQQEESLKRTEAESAARAAQLEMLRYQLNPHFLFNTLNAISSLTSMGKSEDANKMILQLSEFLRYSLSSDPVQQVKLSQEIEALQLYLEIEQTRFANRLEVTFNIDEQAQEKEVPSLLLQPLVENAIKYAIAPSEEGGKIAVSAHLQGDDLIITVEDSGPGFSVNVDYFPDGTGVGLRNTRDRLKAIYHDQVSLKFSESALEGAKIEITLYNVDSQGEGKSNS